jgi:hypothetical protein
VWISTHLSFLSNKNETVQSLRSESNLRSNRPFNICGIDFSRNSEPKPRRAGWCAMACPLPPTQLELVFIASSMSVPRYIDLTALHG